MTATTKRRAGNGAVRSHARETFPGQIVLVLQGGGALGAYQAGVFQALHEADVEPDWVIGTSIGAINAAIIAGNTHENRLAKLKEFWTRVEQPGGNDFLHFWSSMTNMWANLTTVSQGIPCFFTPHLPAWLGMTKREAKATGLPILVGRRAMARVGRSRERGETQRFMEVLIDDQTKRIVGAALLGIEADESIHCIIDVMNAGAPYSAIRRAVHIHPTVSELIPTLLGELSPLP